jgi:hypothetical protein
VVLVNKPHYIESPSTIRERLSMRLWSLIDDSGDGGGVLFCQMLLVDEPLGFDDAFLASVRIDIAPTVVARTLDDIAHVYRVCFAGYNTTDTQNVSFRSNFFAAFLVSESAIFRYLRVMSNSVWPINLMRFRTSIPLRMACTP